MDPVNPITSLQANAVAGKRGVPALEQPKPPNEQAAKLRKLEKATSDFEAIFLNQLLKPLAKSVSSSSQGSQLGGDVMMEVAMEKMAETLADKGGIGLGDLLSKNLKNRILGDSIPTVPQQDTGTPQIKALRLQEDTGPAPIKLWPIDPEPVKLDESKPDQVR